MKALLLAKIILMTLVFTHISNAELPVSARKILKKLPQHELNLDFIISAGMLSSSYHIILSKLAEKDSSQLESQAILDTQLNLSSGYLDSQNESDSGFSPESIKGFSYSASLTKSISWGTRFSFSLSNEAYDKVYSAQAQSFGLANGETSASKMSLSLSQPLWKNFGGGATQNILSSGESFSEAAVSEVSEKEEVWFQSLSQKYYLAWNLQNQVKALQKSVIRKKRLKNITQIKMKRGTAEKPDYLQVNSTLLMTQLSLSDAEKNVGELWRNLVINLSLPNEWLQINPMEIPLGIDSPVTASEKVCKDGLGDPTRRNHELAKFEKNSRALNKLFEHSKDGLKPSLDLNIKADYNGVDSLNSNSFSETISGDHPQYYVGLNFTMPLERSREKANVQKRYAAKIMSEKGLIILKDQIKTDFLVNCLDLKRRKKNISLLKAIYKNQNERARLEEKRFQLGRASLINVIQASDDTMRAEISWRNEQVAIRNLSWKILSSVGEIKNYIEKLKTKKINIKL